MDEDQRMASWHLVDPDGVVVASGSAVPVLLRLLPGGRRPAKLAGRFVGLVERAYGWVNAHRGKLSRLLTAGAVARADRLIAERTASRDARR
jgi:predicted DCC family thiol-disulfide oxidoreductase YuxK